MTWGRTQINWIKVRGKWHVRDSDGFTRKPTAAEEKAYYSAKDESTEKSSASGTERDFSGSGLRNPAEGP